jgi:hypothetical protein
MAWEENWNIVVKIVFFLGLLWAFASANLREYLK